MSLFTPKEVSIILFNNWNDASRKKIYRWIDNKKINSVKDGRIYHIKLSELQNFLGDKISENELRIKVNNYFKNSKSMSKKTIEKVTKSTYLQKVDKTKILLNQKNWFYQAFKVRTMLSKSDLAKKLGCDGTHLSRYYSGRSFLNPETAILIFEILGFGDFNELYYGKYSNENDKLTFNSDKAIIEYTKNLLGRHFQCNEKEIQININQTF